MNNYQVVIALLSVFCLFLISVIFQGGSQTQVNSQDVANIQEQLDIALQEKEEYEDCYRNALIEIDNAQETLNNIYYTLMDVEWGDDYAYIYNSAVEAYNSIEYPEENFNCY